MEKNKNKMIYWLIADDFFKVDYDCKIKIIKQLNTNHWLAKIDRWELQEPNGTKYKKIKNQLVVVEKVDKVNEINNITFVKIADNTEGVK